jgi:hypothetical protein
MNSTGTEPSPPCPRCCSAGAIPIVYGFPDEELFEASERGEARLGGCVLMMGPDGRRDPQWACNACGAEW